MKKFIKYWLPVLVVAAIIFAVSSLPEPPSAPVALPHLDKILHLLEYTLLSFLVKRALVRKNHKKIKETFLSAITLTTLYGISDEIHQNFVPNRYMSIFDLAFDFLGVMLGQYLYSVYLGSRKNNPPEKTT